MGACDPLTRRHAEVSRPVFTEARACPDKSPSQSVNARPRCIAHRRNRFVRPTACAAHGVLKRKPAPDLTGGGHGFAKKKRVKKKPLRGRKKEKVMKQPLTLFALSA